ncbi:MAG: DUF1080 domain-containing protein [Planctomycetes bacterium]|nr:DUF1080 domain-containing protein [Planctomycetota bacterium]
MPTPARRVAGSLTVALAVALTGALACAAPAQSRVDGWRELWNGRDLGGWAVHSGTANYFVEDAGSDAAAIVGETVAGSPNSFLCTTTSYGDFELLLEFKVDSALNSGVQLRSEIGADDRVRGYQSEIDMDPKRDRWWSAGLYDEARRGWLDPGGEEKGAAGAAFSAQGRELSRPDDWNELRVIAHGPELTTWLNGELRAQLHDAMTPCGVIALQVHGVGDDPAKVGAQVRFRKLRLRELLPPVPINTLTNAERAAGWRLLFDGTTPAGWRSARGPAFPERGWAIANGLLQVARSSSGESAGGGDLITIERFATFEIELDFRLSSGANSGIKYFVQPDLRPIGADGKPAAVGSAIGCEFQLLDDARHPDAKLGRDGNRTLASLYDLIAAPADKPARAIGEWNTARIVSGATRVEHWLNGVKLVEYERGSPDFRARVAASKYHAIAGFGEWPDGHLLLQDHGDAVAFRNVKVRQLER